MEEPRGSRSWQELLQDVTHCRSPADTALRRRDTEPVRLRYRVDLPLLLLHDRFFVEVFEERTLKSGEARFRPYPLTRALEDKLGDQDRAVLLHLMARAPGRDPDRDSTRIPIPAEAAEALLALAAETGRLHLSDPDQPLVLADLLPLQDERAHPWELLLKAARSGDSLLLTPCLRQGPDLRPADDPVHVSWNGLVFWMNRFSVLSNPKALPWLREGGGGGRIPIEELPDFLERYMQIPGVPALLLPPEFDLAEEQVHPRPGLRIQEIDLHGEAIFLPCFRYRQETLEWISPRTQCLDAARRVRIPRDRDAENRYLRHLEVLGAVLRPGDALGTWTCPTAEFPRILETLDREDWDLRIRDQRVRTRAEGRLRVQSSGIDWFELDGGLRFDEEEIALPALLEALRRNEHYLTLRNGGLALIPEVWRERLGLLDRIGGGDALRLSGAATLWLDLLLEGLPGIDWDRRALDMRDTLRSLQAPAPADPPPSFQGTLRRYQREGLGWLLHLRTLGVNGCLADDMGLGKTVQVLAMLEQGRARGNPPSLAVIPRSLAFNWQEEAARFTPQLRVAELGGAGRPKSLDQLPPADLYLISYQTLLRDVRWLKDREWDTVILDESQAIKNPASQTAKSVRLLRSAHRLTLTGTPVENRVEDLWSQMNFLNPGLLGRKLLEAKTLSADSLSLIAKGLGPFLLRRSKEQVVPDLPEKIEETLTCDLPPAQRRLYDQMRRYYQKSLAEGVSEKGIQKSKILVLEALLRLRQAACHPGLLSDEHLHMDSAKLSALETLLDDILGSGHKALIFSQFTRFLGLLRPRLDEQGIAYAYLDGQTRDRAAEVRRFQEEADCPLFLISLKAGGVGLNLTAADYVILLDPWWNPAIEAQAVDRAHRIGQEKNVFAYRIVARDTIEEKILSLQREKRELADAILSDSQGLISQLTPEDLRFLMQ